jgi:hypothetical protein
VKTDHGWVIEFQHSPIKPEERRSREAFYPKLVWVVDGLRRKRDEAQFLKAWEKSEFAPIGPDLPVRRIRSDECARLEEWAGSPAPVFFDFGEEQVLWWLLPKKSPMDRCTSLISRVQSSSNSIGGRRPRWIAGSMRYWRPTKNLSRITSQTTDLRC